MRMNFARIEHSRIIQRTDLYGVAADCKPYLVQTFDAVEFDVDFIP